MYIACTELFFLRLIKIQLLQARRFQQSGERAKTGLDRPSVKERTRVIPKKAYPSKHISAR